MAPKGPKLPSPSNPTVKSSSLPPLYTANDAKRTTEPAAADELSPERYRSEFRRDYARLIHCPSFRRLQGKAQLFPCQENDFFRNRMSHSLEVAQIAKSIAIKLNDEHEYFRSFNINTDLIEFAGLAHDVGHPPFGHNGEAELDRHMVEYGGFEGNAQTLRILSRLEKKQTLTYPQIDEIPTPFFDGRDCRLGLNLTYRSLAAILKYDREIPRNTDARRQARNEGHPVKGYAFDERELVDRIKENVVGGNFDGMMKTIECSIMDVADDIAYSTYDLEDAFKGGFLTPLSIIAMPDVAKSSIVEKVKSRLDATYGHLPEADRRFTLSEYNATLRRIFAGVLNVDVPEELYTDGEIAADEYNAAIVSIAAGTADNLCRNGYYRTEFTSQFVGRFIRAVEIYHFDEMRPALSKVRLSIDAFLAVEVLKTLSFEAVIMSSRLKSAENRGRWVIEQIFGELKDDGGYLLMPEDWRVLIEANPGDTAWKQRCICDYIAGMTDSYCLEFYERILGRAAPSIQKQH
ncbi:dGTP triphosphohydrolase [Bradyrhizobium sp. YCK136]|uniref:dGTP triphosphohydrolase n=1 Tax=Bradyrhizobium sp. YCK136 TaxID=3351346 RepID=UPI0037C841A2